jgi:CBS domain-containing protein
MGLHPNGRPNPEESPSNGEQPGALSVRKRTESAGPGFGRRIAALRFEEQSMPIGDICVRTVVTTTPDKTIEEAAQLMRVNHVGDLLVIDRACGRRQLHGILTDRDIVMAVVALKLDPTSVTVGDVMSAGLETATEDQGILETIQRMRSAGIRRIPVVSRQGALIGIVSVDDLIQLLADEMGEMAKLISRERQKEACARVS